MSLIKLSKMGKCFLCGLQKNYLLNMRSSDADTHSLVLPDSDKRHQNGKQSQEFHSHNLLIGCQMMKPIHDAQDTPNFEEMSYEEIISYFKEYEFKDGIGHDLISCNPFLILVDLIAKKGGDA